MKNFIEEFKQFIMRGNVLDLAVGVIIGGAFQKIVSSLVGDIALPLLSPILGGINFSELYWGKMAVGNFIEATIDFIIIAFFIFLVVKAVNSMKKESPSIESISKEVELLTEIRDLLKK